MGKKTPKKHIEQPVVEATKEPVKAHKSRTPDWSALFVRLSCHKWWKNKYAMSGVTATDILLDLPEGVPVVLKEELRKHVPTKQEALDAKPSKSLEEVLHNPAMQDHVAKVHQEHNLPGTPPYEPTPTPTAQQLTGATSSQEAQPAASEPARTMDLIQWNKVVRDSFVSGHGTVAIKEGGHTDLYFVSASTHGNFVGATVQKLIPCEYGMAMDPPYHVDNSRYGRNCGCIGYKNHGKCRHVSMLLKLVERGHLKP